MEGQFFKDSKRNAILKRTTMNIEYILKEHFGIDKVCFKSGKFTKQGERALENLCNLLQSLSLLGIEIDYKQAIAQINQMTNNGQNARL